MKKKIFQVIMKKNKSNKLNSKNKSIKFFKRKYQGENDTFQIVTQFDDYYSGLRSTTISLTHVFCLNKKKKYSPSPRLLANQC